MESVSLKKTIHGTADRSKEELSGSLLPCHQQKKTHKRQQVQTTKQESDRTVASARESEVIMEQPGSPCNKIPPGVDNPSRAKASPFALVHSKDCRKAVIAPPRSLPTSSQLISRGTTRRAINSFGVATAVSACPNDDSNKRPRAQLDEKHRTMTYFVEPVRKCH